MNKVKKSDGVTGRLFATTVLFLLAVLCANTANALPPESQWSGPSPYTTPWLTDASAVCSLMSTQTTTLRYELDTNPAYLPPSNARACFTYRVSDNARLASTALNWRIRCADGTAPNTSKPLAEQCPEPVNNCPSAGTSVGITNVTTAWSNSSDLTGNIQIRVVPDGGATIAGSISFCQSSCGISNSGSAPTACWQSSIPSNTGLYRLSCDIPMVSTGQPCTVGSGDGSGDPTIPPNAPACPSGNVGTVNGKTVCLDSEGSTPNNTVPYPKPGNPAPGTVGGGDKSTGVDPVTGAGTGTDGTGTGAAGGGSGGGGGGNVTVEIPEIQTCGLPGKPKCQMDEAGTPADGDSAFTTAKDALDTAITAHTDAMSQVTSDADKDTSWGWFPALPQGTCTPFQMGTLPPIDWCPIVDTLKEIVAWCWALVSLFLILGMTQKAIRGN